MSGLQSHFKTSRRFILVNNVIPVCISPTAIIVVNGQPMASSYEVAQTFGKRHDDVLKRIRSLECSPEFRARNFAETEQTQKVGAAIRKIPYYRMSFDGFVFLVGGFTGKRAAAFKEAYIARFNLMREQLQERAAAQPAEGWREFRFRDEPFRVLKEHDCLWFAAQDVATALEMGDTWANRLRGLNRHSPGQAKEAPAGMGRMWVIDEPALWGWMRSASVERERELQSWINRIVRPGLWGREVQAAPRPQAPTAATPEEALRALVGKAHFICHLGDDGGLVFRELVAGEVVIRPEHVPFWIADPDGAPLSCLPAVLQAAGERLVGSSALPVKRG